ncbi:MAG: molecular chaperone DnaJ [Pseudomonadota bacterium]
MTKRDYYEVLGIEKAADESEIKRAYRKIALECHPDRTNHDPVAEESFKEASEAYEVLSDKNKRQIYDTYGHRGLEGSGFHGFDSMDDIFSSMGGIFEEFFGGFGGGGGFGFDPFSSSGKHRKRRGRDLQYLLEIDFKDAFGGIKKDIKIEKTEICAACEGNGSEGGKSIKHCSTCGGTGQVTHRQGFFVLSTPCSHCHGHGAVIDKVCSKCKGHGHIVKEKKLSVKIPAGIGDGMHLVLRGEGEAGEHGGPAGNLYVIVKVDQHKFFQRNGDDIYYEAGISFPQAALGDKIEIPTMEGKTSIAVPHGTQHGDTLKVRMEGFPRVNSSARGDLIVIFKIRTPEKLTKKQKELLEELKKEL